MNVYVRAFLVWGIIIPILLHAIAPAAMPWWPDTVSTGIAAGFTAMVIVWKTRTDQSLNRPVWEALRSINRRMWKALRDRGSRGSDSGGSPKGLRYR